MDTEVFEYVIDASDVITHVNDAWKVFAEENEASGLGDRVVGSWLWQHLEGVEVKHLFRSLLERVRERRQVVRVPFRCDAPELRRHMMLEVCPLPDDSIQFLSWVVEEADRPKVALLEADRELDPDRLVRMCAWCKRIDAASIVPGTPEAVESGSSLVGSETVGTFSGDWQDLETALSELELFHFHPLPRITHGVCPDCRSAVLRDLGEGG
jgi:hypothetical protein